MGTQALAEAVILQSICDLWEQDERRRSLAFFKGKVFDKYVFMAGLKPLERNSLRRLISSIVVLTAGTADADTVNSSLTSPE